MVDPKPLRTETITRSPRRDRNRIQFRRTHRLPSRRGGVHVASSSYAVPERSRTTGLVFQAILGLAACLALVGVVAASQDVQSPTPIVDPGSPDAPPPPVFVQLN